MANNNSFRALEGMLQRVVNSAPASSAQSVRNALTVPTAGSTGGRSVSGEPTASPAVTPSPVAGSDEAVNQLIRQLSSLADVARSQVESTEANTKAVIENSILASTGSKAETAGDIGKTVLSFLGGGFGIAQLVSRIFSGSNETTPAPLPGYTLPSPVNVEAGISPLSAAPQPLRYGQNGLPEAVAVERPSVPSPALPVTIQVQAIDSRSFLDHSSEIAQAVKEALLNSHTLSDVVTEL